MKNAFINFIKKIKTGFARLLSHIRRENERPRQATRAGDEDELQHTRVFAAEELEEYLLEDDSHQENEPLFREKIRRRPFILSVLFNTMRCILLFVVLFGLALFGGSLGIAKAYVETAPTLDKAQLTKSDRSSFLYDKDGVLITSIADVEYRDWVEIEDIPLMLQCAFVSVEDIRFYQHSGVDMKRLFSAMLEILGSTNASGGSTITQQLIKNKILGNERTFKRKIQEAYLALELEKEIDKTEILEAYLNDIHLGESNYGVKTAAKDYYGKELHELTIRECALLAGLTQNPYYYNPRLNMYRRDPGRWEETVKRTNKVLGSMYQAGYINQQEYADALKEEVHILVVSEQKQMYEMPYFVEYAIRDVVTHLLAERGLTEADREKVENELRISGYHIYTTVDRDMQQLVQETLSTWDSYPTLQRPDQNVITEMVGNGDLLKTPQPQASAVVLDHRTGELRAIVGGRDVPKIRKGLNRAYQSYMEVGSSIKPLAVYGPAFDAGASPATIIGNFPAPIEGWTKEPGYPYIGSSQHIGPLSMRKGITSSLNVMAARSLMEWVGPQVGAQYLINMGANPAKINADGPGLALGTSGLTTIQMAAAFGTIASLGEYKEPLSFTKVVDSMGNVILDAEKVRQRRQVYKQSTAYMLVDVLENAVQSGTGTKAKITNMPVAGKTGTNADYRSVYFAGMTPYYSASIWIGHDNPATSYLKKGATGGDYAAPLWQAFMSKIHEGMTRKDILDVSPASLGLVKKTVCGVSGMLTTPACEADHDHPPITDWFLSENAPTETCSMHAAITICSESGMVATAECPSVSITSGAVVLIHPGNYYDKFTDEELQAGLKNYIRTDVLPEEYNDNYAGYANRCVLHGGGYYNGGYYGDEYYGGSNTPSDDGADLGVSLNAARIEASQVRKEITEYIRYNSIAEEDSRLLTGYANQLGSLSGSLNPNALISTTREAKQALEEAIRIYGDTRGDGGNG